MGKIYTSFGTVSRAFNKVRTELWNLGVLWEGSRLERVPCVYNPFAPLAALGGTMGWYDPEKKRIEFPSVYLPFEALWKDLGTKANALDVLRHEFAHAIADFYPRAVSRGGTFRAAFGGACGSRPAERRGVEGWEERYVSEYATKSTEEDFAETFMLFVKHKGRIPVRFASLPAIRKKWGAVAKIVKAVAAQSR
jgi:hypothetical protein